MVVKACPFFMKAMILFLEEIVGHNKMLILYKLQNLCIIQRRKLIGGGENNSLQKDTIKLTVKYLKKVFHKDMEYIDEIKSTGRVATEVR